jgi:mycothiol synthase
MTYRPATLEDAELASDLMSASYAALPQDPLLVRYRWEHPRKDMKWARFIGEIDARPAAFLAWYHGPWEKLPDRHCEVEVWLDHAHLDRALLRAMFTWIGEGAVADGAGLLLAYCAEDEPEMLESLAELGYSRERIEKVWELDLRAHGATLVKEARGALGEMATTGIELTTLEAWPDADKMRKVYELDASTRQDIPHTLPILVEDLEDFVRRTKAPDRRNDRTWIALHDGRPVALSYLKFPPVRGTVWTGYTCTHADHRGRGIARAVKLQSLAQAVNLGVPYVCTDNDAENAPMLHINEALGYVRRPGFVEHHKRVTKQ